MHTHHTPLLLCITSLFSFNTRCNACARRGDKPRTAAAAILWNGLAVNVVSRVQNFDDFDGCDVLLLFHKEH